MTDTTRERTDQVDALTFTADDWWNLSTIDNLGHSDYWTRSLPLYVTVPTSPDPLHVLTLTATHTDPVPVLTIEGDDFAPEDIPAFTLALGRARLIMDMLAEDIRLYGDPDLAVPVSPADGLRRIGDVMERIEEGQAR